MLTAAVRNETMPNTNIISEILASNSDQGIGTDDNENNWVGEASPIW